jgi:membrane-associated phospholipid phosphatase
VAIVSSPITIGSWRVPVRPPLGWRAFAVQLVVLVMIDAAFETTRAMIEGSSLVAVAHARDVIGVEQTLGLFWERTLQRAAQHGPAVLISAANVIYTNCQRVWAWLFVLGVYLVRNGAYRRLRTTIIVMDVVGLAGFWLYALAPPRLTPGYGFVDTLDPNHTHLQSSLVPALTNLYAAMPSLHTAYALMIGVTGWQVARRTPVRVAFAGYPVVVVLATVVTANHWLLDAVAGGVVYALAAGVAVAWEHARG